MTMKEKIDVLIAAEAVVLDPAATEAQVKAAVDKVASLGDPLCDASIKGTLEARVMYPEFRESRAK